MPESKAVRREALLEALNQTATKVTASRTISYEQQRDDRVTANELMYLVRDGYVHNRPYTPIPLSVYRSSATGEEDLRLIEYEDPKTQRLKAVRPATFLKFIARTANCPAREEQIGRIATILGEVLPTRYGFDFELISGPDIIDLYARTPHTCMTASPSLSFYVCNAPLIRAIRIMKEGGVFGRAILWPLTNDRYYVDRVYPSSGPHITKFLEYVQEQGWLIRVDHGPAVPDLSGLDLVTVPLMPEDDGDRSAHSRGGFPYMDSFAHMKHAPDFSRVMLRYTSARGWLSIGGRSNYASFAYCPLVRGWVWEREMTNARVLLTEDSFRPETRFHQSTLARTHTPIRYRMPGALFNGLRVYAPKEWAERFVMLIGGSLALRQHTVMAGGKPYFIDDTLPMHNGTYLPLQENLRYVAQLPNGLFVLRDDATYNPDTREWSLKNDETSTP